MKDLSREFHAWLDAKLSEDLPSGIKGFAINLYEYVDAYGAELVATPTFDKEDEDWACDDIYMSDHFELPKELFLSGWENALEKVTESTSDYLKGNSEGSLRLRSVKGVAVGFVNGNLNIVWENA